MLYVPVDLNFETPYNEILFIRQIEHRAGEKQMKLEVGDGNHCIYYRSLFVLKT